MFSPELVGPRPRLSGSCSLPKVPNPPIPRLPLPMRTAALTNCACRERLTIQWTTMHCVQLRSLQLVDTGIYWAGMVPCDMFASILKTVQDKLVLLSGMWKVI